MKNRTMGKIILEDIEIYAYHGHLAGERKTGNTFLVNLELDAAFDDAVASDNLEDTFDYVRAYEIVKEEMGKPSSLLEHIAGRIAGKLLEVSNLIWSVKVKVSKLNPPVGGNVRSVSVEIRRDRGE
jgi:7,8-dihydroneopterin aldolase/epimerase/oxygenase